MTKTYLDYIEDMLKADAEIEDFISGMDFNDFLNDKKTINAVIRSFEILGEAAKSIPISIKGKYADIPWKKIAGMRDKLIHEYAGVDLETIWETIHKDLPQLRVNLSKVKQELS